MNDPLHIGIVGCSAEGAALCYRTLCAEAPALLGRAHAHPEVSMHTPSLAAYVDRLDRGDLQGVADLMLASATKLAAIGADFLICPDNTLHQAFDRVAPRSPRPWLHIADEVARVAAARGFRRVGVLGTHWLVKSEVYPQALQAFGIEAVRPDDADRDALGRIIMDELVPGIVKPVSVAALQRIVERLAARGCDAVVLGCTELPLMLGDHNTALPTLDSTRLLARAALAQAVRAQRPA
ncbi:amino acid racemase [Rhizobacter sp. J219]|uniref:aspartate/glutamate racemase family protein n=1 Tax=Rhizobacter sp. J219 TaxID=2898430 RepID=UPI002151A18F|nr:amino acid racemase [Rhizobacter sp. J219]MCR5884099.1 amino acid racemase [Rhizobacter sp. J219]